MSGSDAENSPPRKSKKIHYHQKYSKLWEKDKEYAGWIEASPKGNEFFRCKACGCDLKCGGGKFILNKHAHSTKHINSVKDIVRQPLITSKLSQSTTKAFEEKVKSGEIKMACFLAKNNLSFNVAGDLKHLVQSVCPDSEVAKQITLERTKAHAIVTNVTGKASYEKLLELLQKENVSLIADESTDRSTTKHMALVVRTAANFKVEDNFLTLLPVTDFSAVELHRTCTEFFERENIPYKENMIGFACDEANNMSGQYHSLTALFAKDIPNLFVMKCICHSFHLCASYACKQLPRGVEDFARDVYNYLKNSPKRLDDYKEFQNYLHINSHKILHPSQTRWLSLILVVERLIDQLPALTLPPLRNMVPVRGRPRLLNNQLIIDKVLEYKQEILIPTENSTDPYKIVSKLNNIWCLISNELNNIISSKAMYTFFTCNKYGVRTQLIGECDLTNSETLAFNTSIEKCTVGETSRESMDSNLENDSNTQFVVAFDKEEFEELLTERAYKRGETRKQKSDERKCVVFIPGKWQAALIDKIWNTTRLKCGFQFKNHKINQDGQSGYINGKCKCGSTIRCKIENFEGLCINLKCSVTEGDGVCGKRYLRAPQRKIVAKKLCQKSAAVYRAEQAQKLMLPGDPEPPHLHTISVLNAAKHEYERSLHVDRDPIRALSIMQLHSLKNAVHNLGLNPFFVHYWSNHQLHVYRSYCSREAICIAIEATGSIIKKVEHSDKSKSRTIFLYECVVNCRPGGQFSVCQMITESHNTNSIHFWLMEWIRTGAPTPKEVVCDYSRAILNGAVRAFTSYSTTDEYADACKNAVMPKCYIRIDVAHFIKMYCTFLKGVNKRISMFYLAAIGQLLLSCDLDSTADILRSILTVARSETEGYLPNGEETECERRKNKLKQILTSCEREEFHEDAVEDTEDSIDDESVSDSTTNRWLEWGRSIDDGVQKVIVAEEGNRDNAHHLPRLAERLIKEVRFLLLWSCICRNKFGYGRVPASSASVEGEFNMIKNRLLKNSTTPMRADTFVEKHINYIHGQMKIVDAASMTNHVSSCPEEEPVLMISNNADAPGPSAVCPACPACANGDAPPGAHTCALCFKAVHALEFCSTPLEGEDEGYGERRVCIACTNTDGLGNILGAREIENWGGLATQGKDKPQRKTSKYLHAGYTANEFILHEKLSKVPLMKNGHSIELKSVKIKDKHISLTNTCAFDSMLQIFITGVLDRIILRELISNDEKNTFFQLTTEVASRGLNNQSYRKRAIILSELFSKTKLPNNTMAVNCAVTISDLCRVLFQNDPSIVETSTCDRGCPERRKPRPVLPIPFSALSGSKFNESVEDHVIIPERRPCYQNCSGYEETVISETGKTIVLELFGIDDDDSAFEIRLTDIPKHLKLTFMAEPYHLIGLVNFKAPLVGAVGTRASGGSDDPIGHYSAMCLRVDGTWLLCDDTKDAVKVLHGTFVAVPHVLVYSR